MEVIQHFFHECALTSSKNDIGGICDLCSNDKPISLSCDSCNFDLCNDCSKLPKKVSHDFHPEHPLEFCQGDQERKPSYVICSGCGNMCSKSFYECKECEIYLDLHCAIEANIFRAWDIKEKLHDSHCHLLRRCRPGPDATGFCLLCELPLSPSATCYGCVHCYSFVHESCFNLPREIQHHPVHPPHPLVRQDYVRASGAICDACLLPFKSAPLGCGECRFSLHLRCADSLLRGLMHKSHPHMLFYVASDASEVFGEENPCQICKGTNVISLDSYFHCVECGLKFHFECLEIPESVVKKRYHTHPLVCKVLTTEEDNSLEYCGVCETMVSKGHHIYSCQECDFLGHVSCILREKVPSPLYLKDLFSCDENIKRPTHPEERETNEVENKILVNDIGHIHVMRLVHMSEFDIKNNNNRCGICDRYFLDYPFKCETCDFQAHQFCVKMRKPSIYKGLHQEHKNHHLTLLPRPPIGGTDNCNICKDEIDYFNLFCRICDIIIHISCALKDKHLVGALQRGQKVIGIAEGQCRVYWDHPLFRVLVPKSYPTACTVCDESLGGTALSCLECGVIYHPKCHEVEDMKVYGHPFHNFHGLDIKLVSGSMCLACKLNITKYGYGCMSDCKVSFHTKCIKAVGNYEERLGHIFYNFWIDTSTSTQACSVCATPCGASYYGCLCCNFNAHVQCIGSPICMRNQLHQHSLFQIYNYEDDNYYCAICGSRCNRGTFIYSCYHCKDVFHSECIISMDDREPATEEEQLKEIYLMYLERDLYEMVRDVDYS